MTSSESSYGICLRTQFRASSSGGLRTLLRFRRNRRTARELGLTRSVQRSYERTARREGGSVLREDRIVSLGRAQFGRVGKLWLRVDRFGLFEERTLA